MTRHENRAAFVTGGASGAGRATAIRLAAEGAAVMIADIDAAGAAAVVEEITGDGGVARSSVTDVADETAVAAAITATIEEFGGLHIVHNNAAILTGRYADEDTVPTEMDLEVWDRVLAVDLTGQMLVCKHAIPHLIASGGGSIVNMSSAGSLQGGPGFTAMAVAKGGVNVLTRQVAATYGKLGVRCNALLPGAIMSPANVAQMDAMPAMATIIEGNNLTPRLGTPEDIAALVSFLASDDAGFITGALLPVDGGVTAHWPQLAQMTELFSAPDDG